MYLGWNRVQSSTEANVPCGEPFHHDILRKLSLQRALQLLSTYLPVLLEYVLELSAELLEMLELAILVGGVHHPHFCEVLQFEGLPELRPGQGDQRGESPIGRVEPRSASRDPEFFD